MYVCMCMWCVCKLCMLLPIDTLWGVYPYNSACVYYVCISVCVHQYKCVYKLCIQGIGCFHFSVPLEISLHRKYTLYIRNLYIEVKLLMLGAKFYFFVFFFSFCLSG